MLGGQSKIVVSGWHVVESRKCAAKGFAAVRHRSAPSRDKALERFFATGDGRRLSVQNAKRVANILRSLADASRPEDMNLPGFRFHALVGRDKGRYAVSSGWIEGDAIGVDLEAYH